MGMFQAFIEENTTRPGFIKGVEGLHGDLVFRYHPVGVIELRKHCKDANKVESEVYAQRSAELISKKLVEWNVFNQAGEQVEITSANLLKIYPQVFSKLSSIVLGLDPTDMNPEWSEQDKNKTDSSEASDEKN